MDCHSQKPKATRGVDGHQWYWGEVGVLSLGVFILLIKEFRYSLGGTLRDGFVIYHVLLWFGRKAAGRVLWAAYV